MDSPTCKGIGPMGGLSLPPPQTDTGGRAKPRLSIFSRLALGSLAIVLVTAGVNLYALVQLRQLTALSTQLVSYHYPAIEGAKRLVSSLYAPPSTPTLRVAEVTGWRGEPTTSGGRRNLLTYYRNIMYGFSYM